MVSLSAHCLGAPQDLRPFSLQQVKQGSEASTRIPHKVTNCLNLSRTHEMPRTWTGLSVLESENVPGKPGWVDRTYTHFSLDIPGIQEPKTMPRVIQKAKLIITDLRK